MANNLPAGFRDLGRVLENKDMTVDVMGVVVDYMPAKASRGTDWTCVFSIADVSSRIEGVRVRFFAPQAGMPEIRGIGDVVILRGVKSTLFQGSELLISNFGTSWITFPSENMPTERSKCPLKLKYFSSKCKTHSSKPPSSDEMIYALDLHDFHRRTSINQTTHSSYNVPNLGLAREKFSLLKDVKADIFYDLIGQVVKAFATGDRHELYITDYTGNQLFYNYVREDDTHTAPSKEGDEYGYVSITSKRKWMGPWGQQTIAITLFPPHATYAIRTVEVGDIVRLNNVHVKVGREGIARLEGVLHSDKKYPERVNVSVITAKEDERAMNILRRKKKYEKCILADGSIDEAEVHKRKIDDKQASKPRKQGKTEHGKPHPGSSIYAQQTGERKADKSVQSSTSTLNSCSTDYAPFTELNKHIKAIKEEQTNTPISSILDPIETHSWTTPNQRPCVLPFQNVCYRSCVRVIDFKPDRLEDFAVKCRLSEYDDMSDSEDQGDEDDVSIASEGSSYSELSQALNDSACIREGTAKRKHKWTWRFALLLEDATRGASKAKNDRLIVYVTEEDADYLLNMEACNLRRCPDALSGLREKLFILWGELEEYKTSGGADRDLVADPESTMLAEIDGNRKEAVGQSKNGILITKDRASTVENFMPDGNSTKAFQCCLMEYGVKVESMWHKRFRMFGTTIQ